MTRLSLQAQFTRHSVEWSLMLKAVVAALILVAVALTLLYLYPFGNDTGDLLTRAQTFCAQEDAASVEVNRAEEIIRVNSSLLGGGSTYYFEDEDVPLNCPVVGPDAVSEACRDLEVVTDWETVCRIETEQAALTAEQAELTGFGFVLAFVNGGLGELGEETETMLYDSLSVSAQERVERETLLSDLAQFFGVQDLPDQGVSVEDLQLEGEQAILTVGLNYSGGRVLRDVHLIGENGEWKVDRITVPPQTLRFEETGTLVRNNPGLSPGLWHLVYEAPGQPALTTELLFASSSVCATGVENSTCDPEALEEGERVRILGERADDRALRVIRLEVVN